MSKWSVQLVIGKLITDTSFRYRFEEQGREWLVGLCERGIELNETEIDALVDSDPQLWSRIARRLDKRLKTAVQKHSALPGPQAHRPLTRREQDVLRGVFEGLTNKQIAERLLVSEGAIKATLQQLFRKAHVRTRVQLVRIAVEGSIGVMPRG